MSTISVRGQVPERQNTGAGEPEHGYRISLDYRKRGVSHFQAGPLSVTMGICLNLLFVVYDFEVCVLDLFIVPFLGFAGGFRWLLRTGTFLFGTFVHLACNFVPSRIEVFSN